MVHLPHLGKLRREVKEEAVDADDAAAGAGAGAEASPFHKRSRLAQQQPPPPTLQWSMDGASVSGQQSSQHDFLEEPSPLGLRLKKSPSLVDLIQMKLVQAGKAKDTRHCGTGSASEKLKASNFPGSVLRIGSWELSRQPLFFRETNPQPRKHTLWQATSDFTSGQASLHRRHFLQCAPGMMNRHVEKLIHCDPRLLALSQKNDITLENPYFESRCSIFEDPDDAKCQDFEPNELDDDQSGPQRFRELLSHHSASSRIAEGRQETGASNGLPRQFSNSVTGSEVIKQDGASGMWEPQTSILSWNGFKMPGIRRSMSKSEIANHIGHHIYRQMYSGNLPAADGGAGTSGKLVLDDITRYLLSDSQTINGGHESAGELAFDEVTWQLLNDSQVTIPADERMLMSRVNSLCSLIHKDSGASQVNPGVHGDNEMYERKPQPYAPSVGGEDGSGALPPRQEPFGDLLTHLPRISSFPHFL